MSLRLKIRAIVEDSLLSPSVWIQFLILLSLIAFSIETLPNNSPELIKFLYDFELFCIIVFTIEYFLRIFVSRNR